ncbi:MAG: hypothetical protein L6Q92_05690 [Phycisphaerae bacterium]|nr:hypothetical protein [Phycisphaerae bacterium]
MSEGQRFKLVYTKMQQVLDDETRKEPQRATVAIRHGGEVSREELDEIARLREIVLESSAPDPISFTTT